jgi:IS30 family transposase
MSERIVEMKSLLADKIETITYDNGKEFSGFKALE